jgi:Heparinase II/III-like protein/Galactose oxidase, central domain
MSTVLAGYDWAALGDNAPPVPSTYNTGHPRLPVPDSAFLTGLANNTAALAFYDAQADAWDSTNPGSPWQFRQLLIAYLANKTANPTKAATYFAKIKALANLGGSWGKLLYAVNDGIGNGTYTLTSPSANFLTGCGGSSCLGNILSIEARTYNIIKVPNANTVVLDQNNPPPTGTNLQVRILSFLTTADLNIALIYDWLYNDLDAATRTEFLNQLEILCTEWEENYIGLNASPYNDVFYIRNGMSGLVDALVLYPDNPNGLKHLNFMTDLWFNIMLPVWKQIFGPEGGGWHEAWPDYIRGANGNGLSTFVVPPLLSWQRATGDPIFSRESWLKNFAYLTMYMTRPDYNMESIGDISRPYLVAESPGLGSLNGLAEIYNDPVVRGWARLVNGRNSSAPDGFEPSAWPFYAALKSTNPASPRSALPPVRNFTGWGVLSMRTGWSEDDTSVTLKYGDNFWSHEHFDAGAFTLFSRGLLALDSGSYRSGSLSKHENQYMRQTIAHNTLTITDPADIYPTTFDTYDEFGNVIQLAPPNDGGQRRIGTLYNERFPQLASLNSMGDWLRNWEYYHTGTMVAFASTPTYTYTAVDITAAYNNEYSATTPNATNRTYRVQKAARHLLFIPRGTSAYVIIFDQVTSTNATFVKRWLLHSVNQPIISGNRFEIVRNQLVNSLPFPDLWPYNFQSLLKHTSGTGPNFSYQYDGKLYGWMVQPKAGTISVVGGPGKEFWVEDPLSPGTGTNWNQCMQGQCAANTEGLGPVNDMINPDPNTAPHEPGSWRIEVKPTIPATQDFFFHVMLATTVENTNVPANVTVPANLASGMAGATWSDSGGTYTITFPQSGVGGHITIPAVDEDLLSHAQQLPAQLQVVSGTGQSGAPGSQLASPFVAVVEDSTGNVVPDAAVHFAIAKGNGLLSSTMAYTDNQGLASVTLTMGAGTAGSVTSVMADVNGLAPVQFDATTSGGGTAVGLVAISCSPTSLSSSAASTCTAVLSQPAGTGGATVTLSSNSQMLLVPATVVVPAASTSATFIALAGASLTNQTAIITATLGGASLTATLTLVATAANPVLSSISCSPTSLNSGATAACTVTLSQAAGSGGATITLTSNAPALTVPPTVSILPGSATATFTATAGSVTASQTTIITATFGVGSQTTPLNLVAASSTGTSIPTNTWTMVPTNGFPPGVVGYDNLVYASGIKKFVMWENYHNLTSETNEAVLAYDFAANRWDVWGLNGNFHSEALPESGHEVGMLQYDPGHNVFINYCCHSGSQGYERPEHTWIFDPVGLVGRDVQTPSMPGLTSEGSAAFDTVDQVYVLFERNAGTWIYYPNNNSWVQMTPKGTPPTAAGYFSAMAYDSANNKIYLFGGITTTGFTNDLYTYDVPSNTWTKLNPSGTLPSGRQYPGFAYDSTNNVFLMVSGANGSGGLKDSWIYDPVQNKWTQLVPAVPLPSSSQPSYQRLAYDPDDNVFVLVWIGTGGYANGPSLGYASAQTWLFRYKGTGPNAGTVNSNFSPTAGNMNRKSNAWANEPVLASNGSTLYAGWAETGQPFDTGNVYFPHVYASQFSGSGWTSLGNSYLSLDSEFNGYNEAHAPSMAVVGSTPWISWYKTNNNGTLLPNSLYAKYWNGSAWIGGPIGGGNPASKFIIQNRSQITAVGQVPYIAFLENDRSCYPWCQFLYVKHWDGTSWVLTGAGALNRNNSSSSVAPLADSVSIASDGTRPFVAWTENTLTSLQASSSPQVYVDTWSGTSWTPLGASLNVNPASWAYDASIAYMNGQPYVAWVERSQAGTPQLYVKTWNGSAWMLVGSGSLNRDTATGWSFRPSLVADPVANSLYLAWVEQQSVGQKAQTYVAKYAGGSWSALGGTLNADVQGSAERVGLALLNGQPAAVWGEVKSGSLRQIYVKQWNGSNWALMAGAFQQGSSSCDLNGDGVVNIQDIQLAINQVIGTLPCTTADLQQNGACNVIDVQRIINAAQGKGCMIGP